MRRVAIIGTWSAAGAREDEHGYEVDHYHQVEDVTKADIIVLCTDTVTELDRQCRRLRRQTPDCRIIFQGADPSRVTALDAFRVGVDGFLPAAAGPDELAKAIAMVLRYESFIDPVDAPELVAAMRSNVHGMQRFGLSRAETRVAMQLVRGLTNVEIARTLNRDVSTVKGHVRSIRRKLGGLSRSAAASLLRAEGLGTPALSGESSE